MIKTKILWFLIPVVLIIGIYIGQRVTSAFSVDKGIDQSKKIDQILEYAVDYYYEEVDTNNLVEKAIEGMLDELDPHSIYISADEQVGIEEQFKGNFDGIGIEFQIIDDTITVVSAIPGGPGESVGILPGDRIVEINENNAVGLTNQDVVANLRGEKGTSVFLKVYRPFMKKLLAFSIIRDQIPLRTVDVSLMVNDSVGYIALSKFVRTSVFEVKNALQKLDQLGMKRLIIDLRNNPGGYLDQAVKIADLFLAGDKLIVYTKGRVSDFDDQYSASITYKYENIPLAILVNKGSASASEILTGAVKDWKRGLVIGETTFGKGLVQRPFVLPDNSAVRITVSKYYTPSGREIQRDFENESDYFGIIYPTQKVSASEKKVKSESGVDKDEREKELISKGGITPDYYIVNDELTLYTVILKSKDLFFQFTRKYLDLHMNEIQKKYDNDLHKFKDKFSFSTGDINSFIQFSESNEVEFVIKEFEKDREYIELRLKAYIARAIWKSEGWYTILLGKDNQFNKALEVIKTFEGNLITESEEGMKN